MLRRIVALSVLTVLVLLAVSLPSLLSALRNPALGSSLAARFAEWTRDHGGAGLVTWMENTWYSHNAPPTGGQPKKGLIVAPSKPVKRLTASATHLPTPAPIPALVATPLPGEGQWTPAGRPVHGLPAVYETRLRPDPVHTSEVVGVAWMDTKLLRATLYSGSYIPGGGPYSHTAPINPTDAAGLVAAFNAGFRMQDAEGGYYTDGKIIDPLRRGAASVVIYRNGSVRLGAWGRDVTMTPDVVSVRQNLDLLVDGGHAVPGLQANDNSRWGKTVGNKIYVWRSGLGVTADGALVYVGGPALNITTLADLLVRAGAVRGMELDINTDWVNYATYAPTPTTAAATAQDGTELLPNMTGGPSRYFASWWSRDFFVMTAR